MSEGRAVFTSVTEVTESWMVDTLSIITAHAATLHRNRSHKKRETFLRNTRLWTWQSLCLG